jgi:DNA-binding NarL/FixJ family response regulator
LRATIRLKQLNSAVARPHFLIECEDSRRLVTASVTPASLPHLARLTGREQEVTRLVCNGQSNQEIADAARLSLSMVKKHLHAVYRKLQVSSRSQLMALML